MQFCQFFIYILCGNGTIWIDNDGYMWKQTVMVTCGNELYNDEMWKLS